MTEETSIREQTWYALALTLGALALVMATTVIYPVRSEIAFNAPGIDPSVALLVGVGYWTLFGLLGALRARQLEAGTVLTFHMPFVVAGTILGGPVVGGWMGLLSQFERREFASVPWFGLLGNHATIAIAAVAAGAAGDWTRLAMVRVGADDGVVQFAAAACVALVFVAVNFVLVVPVAAIKRGTTLREAARTHDGGFRATVLAEGILAWLMALVYVSVGWWAPMVCVALVLVVWRAHDGTVEGLRDPMTGLFNDRALMPRLGAAIREARAGKRLHALLVIDMNGLGALNKQHGTLAGDEGIRAIAGRIRTAVRDTDMVARAHKAGDEFIVLLTDLPDRETALKLARRIYDRMAGSLQLRSKNVVVETSGSVGMLILDRDAPGPTKAIAEADRRMQYAKQNRLGLQAEPVPGSETGVEWDQQQPPDPQPHPT